MIDAILERVPKKLHDFFDKNTLQLIDLEHLLVARAIHFERKML